MDSYVAYGDGYSKFTVPENIKALTLMPKEKKSLNNIKENVIKAILNPQGPLRIKDVVNRSSDIVIIIDDNTRPTPTKEIITPLLDYLHALGISKDNIKIIIALGAHKKLSKEEILGLIGEDIYREYRIINHEAFDNSKLTYFGVTSFGTPIFINTEAANADLKILIGLIKPHNQAGYSGGGKSILPGVSGIKTIKSNHSYKSISNGNSKIGVIKGNPIRNDIEESLKFMDNVFIINVVMDYKENIIDIVGGHPIKAHKRGTKILNTVSKFDIYSKYDICICGTPSPIDINFYQMLNSLSAPYRCNKPIIKEGGTIIVAGRGYEGISSHDFYESLIKNSPHYLWNEISNIDCEIKDRPALQIFLEGYLKYNIVVVTDTKNISHFNNMKIEAYDDIQKAVDIVIDRYKDPELIILPYAPYTILNKI